MNDENRTTHVPQKAADVNGGSGVFAPPADNPRALTAASKSAWVNMAPATVMMIGPTIVIVAMTTSVRWYERTPMTLIHHANHMAASASGTLTIPRSNAGAIAVSPAVARRSRSIGTIKYATTPMPIDRPNHCAKLARKPANGSSARVALT